MKSLRSEEGYINIEFLDNWGTTLVGVAITLLVIGVTYVAVSYTLGWTAKNEAEVLITATGTLGTILLATVTAISFFMNQKEMREKRREKVKPLARDELSLVVIPALEKLSRNQELVDTGAMSWFYIEARGTELEPIAVSGRPHLLVKDPYFEGIEKGVYERFEDVHPDVFEEMRKHDKKLVSIAGISDRLYDSMKEELEKLISEENISRPHSEDTISSKVIAKLLVSKEPKMGEEFKNEIWSPHKEEFMRIYEEKCDKKLVESFEELKQEYIRQLEITKHQLEQKQSELLENYRISKADVN